MNRTCLTILALFFYLNVNAQVTEPDPNDEPDPGAPDKTQIICGATARYVDAIEGARSDSNTGNVVKFKQPAGRAASGELTLKGNLEIFFSVTYAPQSSNLVRGEDMIAITARWQRKSASGKIEVLAEASETSDVLRNFGELVGRRSELPVSMRFINPEVSSVIANQRRPMTPVEAVRAGLLPDGIPHTATFNCYMLVGKTGDF